VSSLEEGSKLSFSKNAVFVISGLIDVTLTPLFLNSSNRHNPKSLSPDLVAV